MDETITELLRAFEQRHNMGFAYLQIYSDWSGGVYSMSYGLIHGFSNKNELIKILKEY